MNTDFDRERIVPRCAALWWAYAAVYISREIYCGSVAQLLHQYGPFTAGMSRPL